MSRSVLRAWPVAPLAPTADLLIEGGDERIALIGGFNAYGHPPSPRPQAIALGSSTASTISPDAFAAADALRTRLAGALDTGSRAEVFRSERERLLGDITRLLGQQDRDGLRLLIGASGTDLHRVAARMFAARCAAPLIVSVQPSETGSGLDAALSGRAPAQDPDAPPIARCSFTVREDDAGLVDEALVADRLDRRIAAAMADGHDVLLVVTDVTKTGLIAPGLPTVLRLKRAWGERLTVLVDGCQMRLSGATLDAYLDLDAMVAITGSKFVGGPAFSGALLIPPRLAARLGELPDDPDEANFGLLLRWEAAVAELAALRTLDDDRIAERLRILSQAAGRALASSRWLEPIPTRPLDRSALVGPPSWDAVQSLFAFRVRQPGGAWLDMPALKALHRRLAVADALGPPVHLGQPVCGALRLCFGARDAVAADGAGLSLILAGMDTAIARLEALAKGWPDSAAP